MTDLLELPELPFPTTPSHAGVWRRDEHSTALVATAPGPHRSLRQPRRGGLRRCRVAAQRRDPARDAAGWETSSSAPGSASISRPSSTPGSSCCGSTSGTGPSSASSSLPRRNPWWSPSSPGRSPTTPTRSSSPSGGCGFASRGSIASTPSTPRPTRSRWQLVRVFSLGRAVADHRLGFEVQSPTGDGCTVTFDDIRFTGQRLADLRDGS